MMTSQRGKTTETRPARWGPFALVESLQDEVERFLWPYGFGRPALRERLLRGTRMSPTDIYEQGGYLVVSAELPGIPKEGISVTLQQGDLIIEGRTGAAGEDLERGYFWRERGYRSYYRRLRLPFEAEAGQITATYTDGVLEVHIAYPAGQAPAGQSIPVL
jgi:HSP20 family protein